MSFTFLRFDGIHQGSAGSSKFSHRLTIGMANYLGKALTTGCNNDPECYTKTELMDMYTLTWSRGPDFPLSAFQTSVTLFTVQIHFTTLVQTYKLFFRRIHSYSAASTSQAAYIIGGAETSKVIAEFRNDSWRLMNNLYRGREAHGSIALGNKIMVIGGYGDNNK